MIDVVGVPASGFRDIPENHLQVVHAARIIVGSPRLLELLPDNAPNDQRPLPSPLLTNLPGFITELDHEKDGVVVLATGDPLTSGIASTLIRLIGPDNIRVLPAVSSVTLAHAAMRWPTDTTQVVSLVSSPVETVLPRAHPGARLVVLSADENTPTQLCATLTRAGLGDSRVTVVSDLGTDHEKRCDTTASTADIDCSRLNIVCVSIPDTATTGSPFGLPDNAFDHDGQLTKTELRILALAALRPTPGQLLWDLGGGAGSIGIEWARHHRQCRAITIERDPARAARIEANTTAFGVGNQVTVRIADHTDIMTELATPHAVFIGGGLTTTTVDDAWAALAHHGRLAAHAVTIESEQILIDAHRRLGGQLRRFTVDRAEPLGRSLSWTPARPVVQWSATKGHHT